MKCEGTAKDKVMQEYTEEMQYICKKDKVSQEKRIWESKYKINSNRIQGTERQIQRNAKRK